MGAVQDIVLRVLADGRARTLNEVMDEGQLASSNETVRDAVTRLEELGRVVTERRPLPLPSLFRLAPAGHTAGRVVKKRRNAPGPTQQRVLDVLGAQPAGARMTLGELMTAMGVNVNYAVLRSAVVALEGYGEVDVQRDGSKAMRVALARGGAACSTAA